MKTQSTLIAAGLLVALSLPGSAQTRLTAGSTPCTNGSALTVMNPDALACSGSWQGNDVNQMGAVLSQMGIDFQALTGRSAWSYLGTTDAGSTAGPFSSVPGSVTGRIAFDNPVVGFFAVALKSSTNFSIYLFNGGPKGISSVDFSTIGTSLNKRGIAQDLSHASLFDYPDAVATSTGVVAAPEPASLALLATGLLAVAGFTRRRKS